MHLNLFVMTTGHHEASWRLPESDPYASIDLAHYTNLARIAEDAAFDSLFLADSPHLPGPVRRRPWGMLEPLTLATALAAATERIGLIATVSTSYNEPYNVARTLASLDHLSGGRFGWNVVTSPDLPAARNFGLSDLPSHASRYARAAEFIEVAFKLWDSWADDAIVGDKAAAIWADESKVCPIDHVGEYFSVAGPLNVPRPPQGHPLLVQAGSSEEGRRFAGRYAEAVFTAQQTLPGARAFAEDLKARAAAFGRDPSKVKILPGLVPIIGSTTAEARALEASLSDLISQEYAQGQLASLLQVPVSALPLDSPLPFADLPPEESVEGARSRFSLVVDLARRENLTVRQLIGRLGGGRGHLTITGTPEQVADEMQAWYSGGAADGFNIMPAVLPSGLSVFCSEVVPLLRKRGLFRSEYTGRTLREHYGLDRPAVAVPAGNGD
ncbi:LLM class flavin-dependent oxidoreductase [Catenulispora pinisilvae]|uniref:LLM class flavin-dependent oxidoreductase n=1 Tax=Catenulispora pinisilvae TaxID=2705253 RepID=UPI001891063C|nr:LLM class flavin-dependent oxidoreductase [Catenulispora pinisilvae]